MVGRSPTCSNAGALPYEPNYTGHREAEKRRKEVRKWLGRRELEIGIAPSIVPEHSGDGRQSSETEPDLTRQSKP
jgi:hypothetical protein